MTFLNRPWPYFIIAAFAGLMIWYSILHRKRPGAQQFTWLLGMWLLWAVSAAITTLSRSNPFLYMAYMLQNLCSLITVAQQMVMVLEYTGHERWINWRTRVVLFLPALIMIGIVVFSPGLVGSIVYRAGVAVFAGGMLKWFFYAYGFITMLIASAVLVDCMLRAPAFRVPLVLLLVGPILPLAGVLIANATEMTISPIQFAIFLTSFTMLSYSLALFNYRILQAIPVARDAIISQMPYALIVLDSEGFLVDFNQAAQELPGLPAKLRFQLAAKQGLGDWWEKLADLIDKDLAISDVAIGAGEGAPVFQVLRIPLVQPSGWKLGEVFLIADATQLHQAMVQQTQTERSLAALLERERLARELHDSLGQTLAATRLQTRTVKILLERKKTPQALKVLDDLDAMTTTAETDVREYLLGTRAAFSTDRPFFQALREYVDHFTGQYGLRVELEIAQSIEQSGMGFLAEVQVMRIIQEALSNVRKHAHATRVDIRFKRNKNMIQIAIIDDGQGFVLVKRDRDRKGFGLEVMRERVEELQGRMNITSQPGRGTRITAAIPVEVQPIRVKKTAAKEQDEDPSGR